LTWHLHHPLVAVLAAAALVVSFRGLPQQGTDRYVDRLIGRPIQVRMGNEVAGVYLLRHGDDPTVEFQIINPNKESWDRLSRLTQERPKDLLYCNYHVRTLQRGIWYPINEQTQRQVIVRSLMPDEKMNEFAPGEVERARQAYLAWLASPTGGNSPVDAAAVASGDVIEHRIVMPALIKNAGTIGAAALLLLSLRGMPNYVRVWLADRRLRRGRCGVCKYDLSATERGPEGVRCPECGVTWVELPRTVKGAAQAPVAE
jgi:hypothetical protein